jgi:hypothetical protein
MKGTDLLKAVTETKDEMKTPSYADLKTPNNHVSGRNEKTVDGTKGLGDRKDTKPTANVGKPGLNKEYPGFLSVPVKKIKEDLDELEELLETKVKIDEFDSVLNDPMGAVTTGDDKPTFFDDVADGYQWLIDNGFNGGKRDGHDPEHSTIYRRGRDKVTAKQIYHKGDYGLHLIWDDAGVRNTELPADNGLSAGNGATSQPISGMLNMSGQAARPSRQKRPMGEDNQERMNGREAFKHDHDFWVDSTDGMWGVFGTETGFCYGTHMDTREAELHAQELKKEKRRLMNSATNDTPALNEFAPGSGNNDNRKHVPIQNKTPGSKNIPVKKVKKEGLGDTVKKVAGVAKDAAKSMWYGSPGSEERGGHAKKHAQKLMRKGVSRNDATAHTKAKFGEETITEGLDVTGWDIRQGTDGSWSYVNDELKLATPSFGNPEGLKRNSDIIRDNPNTRKIMSERYVQLFNQGVTEEHIGFKKLKNKLSHEKGVTNPGALAARIGRKKYGAKKMNAAAKAHHAVKEDDYSMAKTADASVLDKAIDYAIALHQKGMPKREAIAAADKKFGTNILATMWEAKVAKVLTGGELLEWVSGNGISYVGNVVEVVGNKVVIELNGSQTTVPLSEVEILKI